MGNCNNECINRPALCPEPCDPLATTAQPAITPDYDPDAYPGTVLRWGASGTDVANMQARLNNLAGTYTAINRQTVDGKFGQNMFHAVVRFQRQFGLNPDGAVGPATWQRIVQVDNDITGGSATPVAVAYPGYVIGRGSAGDNVRLIQSYMSAVPGMPATAVDGVFGSGTDRLVRAFQTKYGLKVDGLVGRATWEAMVREFNVTL